MPCHRLSKLRYRPASDATRELRRRGGRAFSRARRSSVECRQRGPTVSVAPLLFRQSRNSRKSSLRLLGSFCSLPCFSTIKRSNSAFSDNWEDVMTLCWTSQPSPPLRRGHLGLSVKYF